MRYKTITEGPGIYLLSPVWNVSSFRVVSTVDFQMPHRLYQYMGEIWRDILKDTEPVAAGRKDYRLPVVPITLYNGAETWIVCRQFKECLAGAEQFGKYIVDFEYFLIDVNRYSAKELLGLRNLIGGVFFQDQKKDKKIKMNYYSRWKKAYDDFHPTLSSFLLRNI